MMLVALIAFPTIGSVLAWLAGRRGSQWTRLVALAAMAGQLGWAIALWASSSLSGNVSGLSARLYDVNVPWIGVLGINFHLMLDGLSMLLVLLTGFVGVLSVLSSWKAVTERPGLFYFLLLWLLAGITGIFLAMDLFLFYFFWEMMLIPLYFLIRVWGQEDRLNASIKFFIYTQAGGLVLLLGILGLYFAHGAATGVYTFELLPTAGHAHAAGRGVLADAGLLHRLCRQAAGCAGAWLACRRPRTGPDVRQRGPGWACAEGRRVRPAAIRDTAVFLAAALAFAPAAMVLGVVAIYYGALVAFSQTNLKRFLAYMSISHMGFVLLGVFAWNELSLQGVVIIMLSHGLSAAGLFIVVGMIHERLTSRDMDKLGGLWSILPRLGGWTMVLALASIGLPGLANFVGEFLVLAGVYQVSPAFAALGAGGMVVSVIYMLWMVQKVFFGPPRLIPPAVAHADSAIRSCSLQSSRSSCG